MKDVFIAVVICCALWLGVKILYHPAVIKLAAHYTPQAMQIMTLWNIAPEELNHPINLWGKP